MLKKQNTDKRNQRPASVEQYGALVGCRTNIKISTLPELVYGFNAIIIKTEVGIYFLVNRLILKRRWKGQGTEIARQFWRNKRLDYFCKAKVIEAMQDGWKHKLME